MFSHDTFEAWILFILAVVQSRFVYGYPGRRNQDGTYTLDVPGRPGYIYVTIWRGGQIGTDEAVNFGANANPNLLVRMERVNGKLVIISPDPSAAVALFGQYASMAAVPPHAALIGSGIDDPVEGRRFVPGLLAPSSSGGLNVMVFPFYTPYGYVAGDSAFVIDDPATAGKTAWVVVYADTNNDLQYVVGAEYDASTLDESTIPTDVTLPAGATPVGAVAVTNGGSVTTSSQFADYRFHFNTQRSAPVNWLNFDDSTELTIASGAVTATQTWHRIDTQSDASSDDLDTINGLSDGRILIFRAENTARTVVVKHGTGNIQTFTGSDITLDETYKVVIAVGDGTLSKWLAFGVGGGGGGGSGTDADAIHINAADEFDTAAQKTTPVANDLLLIEDSEDGYAKKYATVEDIANSGTGAKQRVVGTVLYENLAPTSGKYDIQDSAFATYDRLVLYLENAESSVNATSDGGYLEYGTVGGAVDTTATNYFTQFSGAANAANNVANEFNSPLAYNVSGSSASTPAGYATSVRIEIQNPGDTSFHKRAFIEANVGVDSGQLINVRIAHVWRSTSAIGRIQLRPDGYATDTFTSTTRLTIIGYKKESIGAGVGMAADGSVPMTGNLDMGGNALTNGTVPSSLIQTSEFTSTATGTQNDFAFSNADLIRMNNASDVTITGLAAGKPGQRVTIVSIGAGNVYLAHQNAGSTAANRLINNVTSADTPLAAGKGTATFVYDDTTDRWRLVAHEQGAAIAYTCAWTAVSVNPAIGNGSLAANYTIIGDRCFLEILITMGSTTTYGTGAWRLSLPVPATASVAVGMTGRFRDASVPAFFMIMATLQTTTTFSMATESSTVTDASSPFAWAVNDTIHISGEYRAA